MLNMWTSSLLEVFCIFLGTYKLTHLSMATTKKL